MNPVAAKDFIKYLTSDDAFIEKWAKDPATSFRTPLFVQRSRIPMLSPSSEDKPLCCLRRYAGCINGKLTQGTDQAIEALFNEATIAYINGEKAKIRRSLTSRARSTLSRFLIPNRSRLTRK
jgi:hypothetical protein